VLHRRGSLRQDREDLAQFVQSAEHAGAGAADVDDWNRVRPLLRVGPEKFNNRPPTPSTSARSPPACSPRSRRRTDVFVVHLTMGFEDGLRALARTPDLVADMVATYSDYLLAMLDLTLARGYRFDALWFWSDLCYRGGLLFSPAAARKLVLPHWKRFGDFAHAHGMRFMFHCDGGRQRPHPSADRGGLRRDPSTGGGGRATMCAS